MQVFVPYDTTHFPSKFSPSVYNVVIKTVPSSLVLKFKPHFTRNFVRIFNYKNIG